MYNPFSLEGKTILVTGASSGIGKSTSIECSKMGAKLVITGRNEERLNNTFSLLEGEGHSQLIADMHNEDDVDALVDRLPSLDGIVHCAGVTEYKPFQFVNKDNLNEIFSVNFFAPVLLSSKTVKKKLINKNSSIVFISSISGIYTSYISGSPYSATKGAINGIVKGMALDLAVKKVRVNTVCPAMVDTDILKEGKVTEEQVVEDMKKYPLKRYGKPEEIAHAVIYLLSDASGWVTGTNLLIDGGYTLL